MKKCWFMVRAVVGTCPPDSWYLEECNTQRHTTLINARLCCHGNAELYASTDVQDRHQTDATVWALHHCQEKSKTHLQCCDPWFGTAGFFQTAIQTVWSNTTKAWFHLEKLRVNKSRPLIISTQVSWSCSLTSIPSLSHCWRETWALFASYSTPTLEERVCVWMDTQKPDSRWFHLVVSGWWGVQPST